MKRILHSIISLLLLVIFPIEGYSQACALSGTELSTNGSFETGSLSGWTSPISGGCKEVVTDATHNGSGCGYSAFQDAANTPSGGSYAFLYDGGSATGNLLCQTITLDRAKTYDISAKYRSAAKVGVAIGNISNLRITVDLGSGPFAIGSGWAPISNQSSYATNECFYKPGGSGTVSATICIEFQPTDDVSPGNFNSGNDALIDQFSVQEIPSPSGGCTAGSCTYPVTAAPVKLVSFTAKRAGENEVSLKWTSSSEVDFSYYSLQKSTDALVFWEMAAVSAKGSSTDFTNYEYNDSHFDRSSCYRLKMVDKDGKFEYSKIAYVQKEGDYVWVINTGSNDLSVNALVKKSTSWNIACYSMLGQEYFTEKLPLSEGENNIPLNNLVFSDRSPKILKITDDEGKVILSQIILAF